MPGYTIGSSADVCDGKQRTENKPPPGPVAAAAAPAENVTAATVTSRAAGARTAARRTRGRNARDGMAAACVAWPASAVPRRGGLGSPKEDPPMTNLGRAMLAGALGIASLFGTAHRAAADDACFYRGTMYSEGGMSCQNGHQYKCDDGEWDDTDSPCQPERVAASKPCSFEGISYSTGSASCQAGTQFRCEDGSWRNLGSQCAMLSGNTIKVEPSGDT